MLLLICAAFLFALIFLFFDIVANYMNRACSVSNTFEGDVLILFENKHSYYSFILTKNSLQKHHTIQTQLLSQELPVLITKPSFEYAARAIFESSDLHIKVCECVVLVLFLFLFFSWWCFCLFVDSVLLSLPFAFLLLTYLS